MSRLVWIVCYLVAGFGTPPLQAEAKPATLLVLPASCGLAGQVLAYDVFGQGFLLKLDVDGKTKTETVPFSRWTNFFDVTSGLKIGTPKEIEPTAIRTGDRLCVMLDPSAAIARIVFVVRPNPVVGQSITSPSHAAGL
jgi:hypothetical protein